MTFFQSVLVVIGMILFFFLLFWVPPALGCLLEPFLGFPAKTITGYIILSDFILTIAIIIWALSNSYKD